MLLFGGLASCSLRAFKALGLDLIGKELFGIGENPKP